jgi:Leucine-rich repeat (LRR) protein
MGVGPSASKDKKGQSVTLDLKEKPLDKWIAEAKKANSLKHIERLDLSRQELTELPAQIAKLVNLKILQMYDNGLKLLPPEIGALVKRAQIGRVSTQCFAHFWAFLNR